MITLPSHYEGFRATTHSTPPYVTRKTCSCCGKHCHPSNGKTHKRANSCRREWVCFGCKPKEAAH